MSFYIKETTTWKATWTYIWYICRKYLKSISTKTILLTYRHKNYFIAANNFRPSNYVKEKRSRWKPYHKCKAIAATKRWPLFLILSTIFAQIYFRILDKNINFTFFTWFWLYFLVQIKKMNRYWMNLSQFRLYK